MSGTLFHKGLFCCISHSDFLALTQKFSRKIISEKKLQNDDDDDDDCEM
jgi:hypothetical protein